MGIVVSIFKDARIGPCANGGISDTHEQVTVVNVDGPFEPTPERPAVEIVHGNLPGTVKAVPADGGPDGHLGPMAGGSYVATSDSRFGDLIESILGHRFYGAVPLHDRYETPAQYRALSA